jgi:hypothetical protein
MEHVQKVQDELDKFAQSFPEYIDICKKYKAPPGLILGGVGFVVTLIGVYLQGYNIVCTLITCVYPMWMSIKSIESEDNVEASSWLCFWTVFGLF